MTARVFLQGINEVHPGNYIVVNDVTGDARSQLRTSAMQSPTA